MRKSFSQVEAAEAEGERAGETLWAALGGGREREQWRMAEFPEDNRCLDGGPRPREEGDRGSCW